MVRLPLASPSAGAAGHPEPQAPSPNWRCFTEETKPRRDERKKRKSKAAQKRFLSRFKGIKTTEPTVIDSFSKQLPTKSCLLLPCSVGALCRPARLKVAGRHLHNSSVNKYFSVVGNCTRDAEKVWDNWKSTFFCSKHSSAMGNALLEARVEEKSCSICGALANRRWLERVTAVNWKK